MRRTSAGPPHHGSGAGAVAHRRATGRSRWHGALPRWSSFALEHFLLLPLGAAIALAWANTWPESYFRFAYGISFYVNDVAMVFFFALVTKEIVESTVPGGVLHPWRRAIVPIFAAAGGVIVPAFIYAAFVRSVDEPMLARAWLIPGAVDVAAAYFVARLIFRPRHPAVPLVLLLAIAANGVGFVVLALYFPIRDLHLLSGMLLMALALGVAGLLRRVRVKSFWPYVLVSGSLSWTALYWGGLHPALALAPIMPFLPHATRDPGFFVDAPAGAKDTLNRFELWWRYPGQIALFFFGLVNAGVIVGALEQGVWAVPVAAFLGKPIGILAAVGLAVAVGFHLPHRLGWRDLIVVGLVSTIGFTLALFFATAVLGPGQFLGETKIGALLSLAGAPAAFLAARLLRVGRYSPG